MTHPTPLSTAASEDLVDEIAQIIADTNHAGQWLRSGRIEKDRRRKEATAVIERLRQPVAGDASDLVKALEGIAAMPDEENEWDGVARFHLARKNARAALTRHRQGEK